MVSRLRFQNTPDFSFRGVLKSSGRPFTSPIYEKCRPKKNIKKRKKRRRVSDIKKILVMTSCPTSIIWIGYHGYILGDIDPACGSFTDTSCVSRGKQLMDLTTKYRYMLDQLMSTVNASGSHSTGQECKVPLQNARS